MFMEWNTAVVVAQTVAVSILITAAIMWCFFEEIQTKEKKD